MMNVKTAERTDNVKNNRERMPQGNSFGLRNYLIIIVWQYR